MGLMKSISISLGVLVIVGLGGYFGYNAAYAMGETAGYDIGYPAGEEAGYSLGKQDGYEGGYISGKQDGYDEGYSSGRADGYGEGYSSGKTDGYKQGYDQGMEAGLGHGYTLRDPTYNEVVTFLRQDKTDENKYVEDTYGVYVCSHFARDVNNNAEASGLRCAFVEIRYKRTGHTIIAFNTIDKGLAYFEPQNDWIVRPVTGKRFYQCIEPPRVIITSHLPTMTQYWTFWLFGKN